MTQEMPGELPYTCCASPTGLEKVYGRGRRFFYTVCSKFLVTLEPYESNGEETSYIDRWLVKVRFAPIHACEQAESVWYVW
jgi:hypothetical protein